MQNSLDVAHPVAMAFRARPNARRYERAAVTHG
jgi:hypothetical protein